MVTTPSLLRLLVVLFLLSRSKALVDIPQCLRNFLSSFWEHMLFLLALGRVSLCVPSRPPWGPVSDQVIQCSKSEPKPSDFQQIHSERALIFCLCSAHLTIPTDFILL